MFQEVTLIGRLGSDPEMRHTPAGQPVTNFSLAANRRYPDGNDEQVEETLWFRVTAWGKLAESTYQYLATGRLVLVKGRLQADPATGGPRTYTRRDGTVGASFEVNASTVLFLSGRGEAAPDPATTAQPEEAEIPF